MKNLYKIHKDIKVDNMGRTIGFGGHVGQWQNSNDKTYYAGVYETRNGKHFGHSSNLRKFFELQDAINYINNAIEGKSAD